MSLFEMTHLDVQLKTACLLHVLRLASNFFHMTLFQSHMASDVHALCLHKRVYLIKRLSDFLPTRFVCVFVYVYWDEEKWEFPCLVLMYLNNAIPCFYWLFKFWWPYKVAWKVSRTNRIICTRVLFNGFTQSLLRKLWLNFGWISHMIG